MGDSASEEKLQWAVKNGDIDSLNAIVEGDAGVVNKFSSGRPPMCVAADYNQSEVIEYLLSKGANLNVTDKHGITPLLAAIYEGHTSCVQLLLSRGADKSGKAPGGESYVECAEKEEIKALLLQ